MFVIRPVELEDLDQLDKLAHQASPGMTNLPAKRELLEAKIQKSVNSFAIKPTKAGSESYMFVLVDSDADQIIGTSEVLAKIGGFEPFYSYTIKKTRKQSTELNVDKEVETLNLTTEHNGPSEICGLFLSPEYRGRGLGRLLSLSRFLFINNEPQRFEEMILADMRGVIDDDGNSPFWNKIVRHFFDMEYKKADLLSATNKRFIADLMPKHPIYIAILPDEAKAVIGKVHQNTEPDLKFLMQEGFEYDGHIDIFDAGPRLQCPRAEIRTIKETKTLKVAEVIKGLNHASNFKEVEKSKLYIVSNCSTSFKVCIEVFDEEPKETINISYKTAKALDLKHGDDIRCAPLFASKPSSSGSSANSNLNLIHS